MSLKNFHFFHFDLYKHFGYSAALIDYFLDVIDECLIFNHD